MEYLDTVKEKIAEYIAREPVVETDEVVSAYTLFSAIENCKKRLRHVEEIEKGLVDKLNSIYPQTIIKEKKGLFNKKAKVNRFYSASCDIKEDYTKLCFWGNNGDDISLKKDYLYSDIYSINKGLTEDAYNECIDDIHSIFSELDYFGSLFNQDDKNETSRLWNEIKCEGFNLNVKFDTMPSFSYGIELNKGIAPNGHADAHFYGKDNNVDKVINDNIVAILKNTPVNLSDLSYMFCMIVLDYRKMTEQDRIDEEIDKVFQKLYEKK